MSKLTPISLPQSVPFPVTVTQVMISPGQTLPRHQPLLKYKYWDYQDNPNDADTDEPTKMRVERIGTIESPITGEVEEVCVWVRRFTLHQYTHCRYFRNTGNYNGVGGMFLINSAPKMNLTYNSHTTHL